MLREHEGDEGKALGFLGQAVDGVMQLRQGTCRQGSGQCLGPGWACTLGTEQVMVFTGESIGLLLWVGLWPEAAVRPPQRSRVSMTQPFMRLS